MPRRDGTGNPGRGAGVGRGAGRRGGGPLGSMTCTCPKCGHQIAHSQRGVPCNQTQCPKCGTLMTGEFC